MEMRGDQIKAKTTVIDVRSLGEFLMGHVEGSMNIPLQEIPDRMEEIRSMEGVVILCCASGNRSGQAEMFLRGHGIANVQNGGSWMDVADVNEKTK